MTRSLFILLLIAVFGAGTYFLSRYASFDKRSKITVDLPSQDDQISDEEDENENAGDSDPSLPNLKKTDQPKAALKNAPSPESQTALPETTLKEGFESLEKGELRNAEDAFLKHVQLYPIDPQGHFGLGRVYRLGENFDQSLEEFAKTLLLDDGHLHAKFQVAEMLTFQMKDEWETAERYYQEILEMVPEEKSAVNGLATIYLSTGRVDESIQLWENMSQDMPGVEAIASNLANAYLLKATQAREEEDEEAAKAWSAKARSLNPELDVPAPEESPIPPPTEQE